MRLSDFPIYQRFVNCYEFARLNKVTITYWPKYNMQLNQETSSGINGQSVTGTLITAMDQIPLVASYAGATTVTSAVTWISDSDVDSPVTLPFAAGCNTVTPTYVRGLQGSHEAELYKKQSMTFQPAFYDYILDNPIVNTTTQTFGSNASATGCFERKIRKWVNIVTLVQPDNTGESGTSIANNGPVYYGPVYALDINSQPDALAQSLFDVRMTYSMSFKRLKGSVGNLT